MAVVAIVENDDACERVVVLKRQILVLGLHAPAAIKLVFQARACNPTGVVVASIRRQHGRTGTRRLHHVEVKSILESGVGVAARDIGEHRRLQQDARATANGAEPFRTSPAAGDHGT